MEAWEKHYKSRSISAEEAARFVKSGDRIVWPLGRETFSIGLAIAARREELRNVEVFVPHGGYDFGWYDPGWEESFSIEVLGHSAITKEPFEERRVDLHISFIADSMWSDPKIPDIVMIEISSPDRLGFCSFGASVWDKKRRVEQAKTNGKLVLAEVNPNLMRTHGDNFIHVSMIDYFVEHVSAGGAPGAGSLSGRALKKPDPRVKPITEYVSSLIRDGDTFQIGVGRINEFMVSSGLLDDKHDLGYHSEATPAGIITKVKEGVINGRRKTLNPGRVVVTAIGGSTKEEMAWVDGNPLFWVMDSSYVEDVRNIAAHDNFVAINQCLLMDITGQSTAESIGPRLISSPGGQLPFVIGAMVSKGGRSIHVLPSTGSDGKSRIVPWLPEQTQVTIPRTCTDFVVTEYGIASLKGKTARQRTDELIAIAHPDFRKELRSEARRMLWP